MYLGALVNNVLCCVYDHTTASIDLLLNEGRIVLKLKKVFMFILLFFDYFTSINLKAFSIIFRTFKDFALKMRKTFKRLLCQAFSCYEKKPTRYNFRTNLRI